MRITKPLIGTAAGAAVLGATLAFGLTMASASTSSTSGTHASSTTSSFSAAQAKPASPAPKASTAPAPRAGHKCTHMSGSGGTSASAMPAGY